jgi:hypothetical protein
MNRDGIDWVTQVVAKLETAKNGVLSVEIGGVPVVATFGPEVIIFFKDNRILLTRLGQESFANFLILLQAKKEEQAFNLLLAKMDADEIIARMEMNATVLHEYNTNKDLFVVAVKKWVIASLAPALLKVLIGLLI